MTERREVLPDGTGIGSPSSPTVYALAVGWQLAELATALGEGPDPLAQQLLVARPLARTLGYRIGGMRLADLDGSKVSGARLSELLDRPAPARRDALHAVLELHAAVLAGLGALAPLVGSDLRRAYELGRALAQTSLVAVVAEPAVQPALYRRLLDPARLLTLAEWLAALREDLAEHAADAVFHSLRCWSAHAARASDEQLVASGGALRNQSRIWRDLLLARRSAESLLLGDDPGPAPLEATGAAGIETISVEAAFAGPPPRPAPGPVDIAIMRAATVLPPPSPGRSATAPPAPPSSPPPAPAPGSGRPAGAGSWPAVPRGPATSWAPGPTALTAPPGTRLAPLHWPAPSSPPAPPPPAPPPPAPPPPAPPPAAGAPPLPTRARLAPPAVEGEALLRPLRRRRRWRDRLAGWGLVVLLAVGITVLLRTFVVQPFSIPSGSMVPTLQVGDRILVDKLPFVADDIHVGDIIVFGRVRADQVDPGTEDLVKRVVGLPGERISSRGNTVLVDGRPISEPWLPPLAAGCNETTLSIPPQTIPPGHYFVLGDCRGISYDSRYWGTVPSSHIVGKVFLVVWRHGHPWFHWF